MIYRFADGRMYDEDGAEIEFVQPRVRTRFNYNADLVSVLTGLSCPEETKTQQHFAEECDINTIVRRFGLTGQLPENVAMPTYGDYEGVFDFQTAMNTMMDAEKAFMSLPAEVRARFANDPQSLLEFCADDKNIEEARKWGLVPPVAPPPAPPEPTLVRVVPEAPGAS